MTVLKRRSRMVSFRLSEEEYEGLMNICVTEGVRSLSDIAREAVFRLLGNHVQPKKDLETELRLLAERMAALDEEVKRLSGLVNAQASSEERVDVMGS